MQAQGTVTRTFTRTEVERIVRSATFAPSILNVQPWRFVARHDSLDLHRDETRVLPVTDPRHRALTISCGAALLNVRLAIAALGHRADVQVLPDPDRPTLLAVVRPGLAAVPSRTDLRLYDAMPRRRTSRVPYADQPIAPEVVVALEHVAATEGAALRVLTSVEAAEMTRLVHVADIMQGANADVRREIRAWTGRPPGSVDGLPEDALGPLARDPSGVVRDFGLDRPVVHRPQADFESHPTLAMLLTDDDDPVAWMRAGRALQRVWLEATAAGLAVSLLTQPLELSNLRWQSRPLLAHRPTSRAVPSTSHRGGWPQVVLRLGVAATSTPRTPRRCVDDVLTFSPTVIEDPPLRRALSPPR